jgi:predicted transcriptional regulator
MAIHCAAMDNASNIYAYVMARLREKRIPQRTVAKDSGVPFSTVCKIAQGAVTDPSVHTVQRLADYFRAHDIGTGSADHQEAA